MSNQIIGFVSTVVAIIMFLSLSYFYKTRFKENMLEGKQRITGIVIVLASIVLAVFLMS